MVLGPQILLKHHWFEPIWQIGSLSIHWVTFIFQNKSVFLMAFVDHEQCISITVWPAVIDLLRCKSFGTRLHPPGETCTTQPHLTALLTSPSMVVKGRAKMDVQVTVKNKGDNAYNTKVLVTFTPNINYVKVEVSCLCSLFASYNYAHCRAVCWWMICYSQPEMTCNPNRSSLECAVGYPFLGSRVEVGMHNKPLGLLNLILQPVMNFIVF